MARGRVKWFNDAKGYGFIERAGDTYRGSGSGYNFKTLPSQEKKDSVGTDEIFVHYTAIQGDGHKTLEVGQEVEFDIYDSPKGRTAQNVVPKS